MDEDARLAAQEEALQAIYRGNARLLKLKLGSKRRENCWALLAQARLAYDQGHYRRARNLGKQAAAA